MTLNPDVNKRRSPAIAVILSLLEPGLGLMYVGRLDYALLISTLSLAFSQLILWSQLPKKFYYLLAALLIDGACRVAILILAGVLAKRSPTFTPKRYNRVPFYLGYVLVFWVIAELAFPDFPLKSYEMASGSMSPALEEGDFLMADIQSYRKSAPAPGEVIAFKLPSDPQKIYVKRCAATGGQTIAILDGKVYVDGNLFMPLLQTKRAHSTIMAPGMKDPRIYPPNSGNEDNYGPVAVPNDSLFVLGDFRDNSLDSRFFGFVHANAVVGKALYVYWSRDLSRIGKTIE